MIKLTDSARIFFSIATIVLLVICMYFMRPILAPLSFSFILAVILLPPTLFLERRGLSPTAAALITVSLATLLAFGAVIRATWQVSTLTDNSKNLMDKVELCVQRAIVTIEREYPQMKRQNLINYRQRSKDLFEKVGDNISQSAKGLPGFISSVLLMPLFIFFMLSYRQFFRRFLHQVTKSENKDVDEILIKIHNVTRNYLMGMVIVMGIVAVLNTIGLMFIGVPYAIFFALLASLLMVVPYFGVFIGSLLPTVMALVTFNSPWPALAVAGWMWGVQILEGNFITPKLVGSKVSINPFTAIISLILMGQIWGLAGLVLAIPYVAILKIILDAIPATQAYGMLLGEVNYENPNKKTKKRKKPPVEQIDEEVEYLRM
jgi:predicted PurR-regulated permease PerM